MLPSRTTSDAPEGGNGHLLTHEERARRTNEAFWGGGRLLWQRRRLIAGVTVAAAILSLVISLLIPKWYAGTTRVLLPDGGITGGLGAVLGDLSPLASRVLGGSSGDYSRYLAILTSDSVIDAVIEEFDLVRVYKNENSAWPRYLTRRELRGNTDFQVDMKYDYLTVSVLDKDPERAAAMANYFVAELNQRNTELSAQNAANYRRYVERRYLEVVAHLDSAQNRMQHFQESHGVIELPMMAEAFYKGMAESRGVSLHAEIQHGALLSQYGPDNPRTRAAHDALLSARRAEAAALRGQEALMPIGMRELPAVANEYARIFRDVLMQTELLKIAQPLYEQARFEEEREKVAVQVVDVAQVPERKAKPKRAFIVLGGTFSVMFLFIFAILAFDWVGRNGPTLRERLRSGPSL